MAIGKIARRVANAATGGTPAPANGNGPAASAPSGPAAEGAATDRTPPRDRPVPKAAADAARKGAEHVEKGKQENADAIRAKSAGERRADREEAPPEVKDENALANQAGEQGGRVKPQRDRDAADDREDGESLVESAKAQARSQGRDGKVDRQAFRDLVNGKPTEDGTERTGLNTTSLVALSEELHQESEDLADGAAPLVDRAKGDPNSMTPDEQAAALSQLYLRQGLLETEDEALDVLASGEAAEQDGVERGLDAVDGDGEWDTAGGNQPVPGLDQEDIDARREEIEQEQVQTQADIDAVIASMSADDAAAIATLGEGGGTATIVDEDGEEVDVAVDEQVVARIAEDHAAHVESGAPVAVDSEVDAAGPEGPDGADGTGGEAPPVPADGELLDAAAAEGVIDPEARGQFAFNEAGELTYAAQPGDGYWQAAEHVAPPAGQDFATHWRNTWTENSMRNHGVPDEQFVGVGQPIVIPGYTRDQFLAAYGPPPVDPAAEGGGDAGDATGTDGAEETGAAEPTGALPANPGDIAVQEAAGPTLSGGPLLVIGGTTVEVPPEDFQFEIPTTHADAQVQVDSAEYGEFTATVRRTGIPGQGELTYEVIEATPTGGDADSAEAPAADGASADSGDQAGGDAPATEPTAASFEPAPEIAAQDPDGDGFVQLDEGEVFIYGGDVVNRPDGGVGVFSNGVPLAQVGDDGEVALAEGSTDADVQAFLSQQLLAGDTDGDGQLEYAYTYADGSAEAIEDENIIQGLDFLLDHYSQG